MDRRLILAIPAALLLAGCGHAAAGANPFDNAPLPSHTAPIPCATPACITADAQRALDATKGRITCKPATVTFRGGAWTVDCAAGKVTGTASVVLASGKVTWGPEG